MREGALRAIAECQLIAAMSEEPGRVTRRFLTPPVHDVHTHLRKRMEALGMVVRADALGNLRGLWQPPGDSSRRMVIGSHIDTVPDAGAFDGVLGVTLALELVALAHELTLPLAIEVIAFSEEEGVRYGVPFLGSRAVAGTFDETLLAYQDVDGVRMDEAIRAFGLDPARIGDAALDESALGFVEIHIEQGPVLEAEGLSVAAVAGIVGQSRLNLEFAGHANHAGTTPIRMRRDALAAAAEWILEVEALALATDGLRATVGEISVWPNAANVIPGAAKLSLDIRHARNVERAAALNHLLAQARTIAERRGLGVNWKQQMDEGAVAMDQRLTALLIDAMADAGFPPRTMPSGAGHDAMVIAARVPTAMLFLRSPRGISHHPEETVREEDVEAALQVGLKFLQRLAADVR